MKRQLTFFDILCLGINGIVGSGIFLLPGKLLGGLGPLSVLQFVLCGLLLIIIALCYAEASSYFERNGGEYNYVHTAFGSRAGYTMGWLAVVSMVFSYATVLTGLVGYAGTMLPWLSNPLHVKITYAAIILILSGLNIRGVRLGADTVNVFTIGKLLPLLFFIIAGLFAIHPQNFVPLAPHGFAPIFGLILATNFAYQGFESAPVPSGEVENASRVVPRAMMFSLLISMLLYCVIQAIIVGSGANVVNSEGPLADAARSFMGPWGATLITIGALVSMSGYVAGSAFLAPRSLEILCEDNYLPKLGAKYHSKFDTPYIAIIFTGSAVLLMSLFLDFSRLVDMSSFIVVLKYFGTCLAVPILRKKFGAQTQGYRVPGGWLFPLLGAAISLLFAAQIKLADLYWTASAIVVGLMVSFAYRKFNQL